MRLHPDGRLTADTIFRFVDVAECRHCGFTSHKVSKGYDHCGETGHHVRVSRKLVEYCARCDLPMLDNSTS